jgi:polyferredoxin
MKIRIQDIVLLLLSILIWFLLLYWVDYIKYLDKRYDGYFQSVLFIVILFFVKTVKFAIIFLRRKK